MDTITREAYNIAREYQGLKEIKGPQDEQFIALAHYLCGIHPGNLSAPLLMVDIDSTVPWCSSWVNLCIVAACARRNPKKTVDMLRAKGFGGITIVKVFDFAKVHANMMDIDTGEAIKAPTWSANSKSWDSWGQSIPVAQAKRGDLIRITRDGGGHVAFLDEETPGRVMLSLFGGNQADQVCSANSFARTRLVQVRRA